MTTVKDFFDRVYLAKTMRPLISEIPRIRRLPGFLGTLPIFIRSKDVDESLSDLEEKIENSGCYGSVSQETIYRIRERASRLSILEEERSGSAEEVYLDFLDKLHAVFDKSKLPPAAKVLISNDALFHIQTLVYAPGRETNLRSLVCDPQTLEKYLWFRIALAEEFFTLDRDEIERERISESQASHDLVYTAQPLQEGVHPFYNGAIADRLYTTLEIFPEDVKQELTKLLAVASAQFIEGAKRRGQREEVLHNLLWEASGKTYPIDHERYHSLGFNASAFFSEEQICELSSMIRTQDPLLGREILIPTTIGFKDKKNSHEHRDIVDKLGFYLAHEATRFVEG
ncbi:MAG: hypothetical protein QW331_00370, partial [Candidatus Woesearchaeota archaeon]